MTFTSSSKLRPEEYARLLHPTGRQGTVTIGQKIADERERSQLVWKQRAVGIKDLPAIAASLEGAADVYLTPNTFWGRRRTDRIAQIVAAFSDLDFYKVPHWSGCDPATVMHAALDALEHEGIPLPSLVLFSGQGLLLLWLHSPLPGAGHQRWKALQHRIFAVLQSFGADAGARDVARVFRLVGTVNRKTGAPVRLVWSLLPIDALSPWPFELLFERAMQFRQQQSEVSNQLPDERGQQHQESSVRAEVVALEGRRAESRAAGAGPAPAKRLTGRSYWQTILADLHRLRAHRYWDGLLPPGQRDVWLFIAAVALSWTSPPEAMAREVIALAHRLGGWSEAEAQSCISSLRKRAEDAALGKHGSFREKEIDLRYRFRAATLIEWLAITPEEMRAAGLRALISEDVAREHDRDRKRLERRRTGVREQTAFHAHIQAKVAQRDEEILGLRERLGSVQAVAAYLAVSPAAAKMRIARAKKRAGTGSRVTPHVPVYGGENPSHREGVRGVLSRDSVSLLYYRLRLCI